MADLTPIQEYNKALRESAREVKEASKGLRTPFKQIVEQMQSVNTEFSKIVAENVSSSQDTMKGLITERRKRKIADELETEEFKKAAERNKESLKKDAVLKQKFYEEERKLIQQRQDIIKKDLNDKSEGSLGSLRKEQEEQQKKFNKASADEQVEISQQLQKISNEISQREAALVTVNKDELARREKQLEDDLKFSKEARAEDEILVNETNEQLKERLKDASNTETYDKFTGGIKTLTGGLVDIEGVLDPIAEKFGALRDVVGSVFQGVKSVAGGFVSVGEKIFGEEAQDDAEKAKKSQEELNEEQEKGKGKFKKFFSTMKLGIGGFIALAAALLALVGIVNLVAKSEFFQRLLGKPEPDPTGVNTERTYDDVSKELKKLLEGPDGKQDLTKMDDPEVVKKLAEMKKLRDEMREKERGTLLDNRANLLGLGTEGGEFTQIDLLGNTIDIGLPHYDAPLSAGLGAYGTNIVGRGQGAYNFGNAAYNRIFNPQLTTALNPDMRYSQNQLFKYGVGDAFKTSQFQGVRNVGGNQFGMTASKYLGVAGLGLSGYLSWKEINANLAQSDDIEKTINMMDESHQDFVPEMAAHPDDIIALRAALENKKLQDVAKPKWMAIAGGVGAIIGGGAATIFSGGAATPLTVGLVAGGVSAISSAVTGAVVDAKYDGDEFLEDYGGDISAHMRGYHAVEDVVDRMDTEVGMYQDLLMNNADFLKKLNEGQYDSLGGNINQILQNSNTPTTHYNINDSSSGATDRNAPQINMESLGFPY